MSDEKMIGRKDGAVGQIIFNNPARHNAVSLEMWQMAEALLEDFAADPDLRVLVVSGAGGKACKAVRSAGRRLRSRVRKGLHWPAIDFTVIATGHYILLVAAAMPMMATYNDRSAARRASRRAHGTTDDAYP